MMVERITGPECPSCGCQRTQVVKKSSWFNLASFERRECGHCGRVFSVRVEAAAPSAPPPPPPEDEPNPEEPVRYVSVPAKCACPRCAAKNPKVTKTERIDGSVVRHHRCDCGHTFKSIE